MMDQEILNNGKFARRVVSSAGIADVENHLAHSGEISEMVIGLLSENEKAIYIRLMSKLPLRVRKLIEYEFACSREVDTREVDTRVDSSLTKRETEVLLLVASGYSRSEISNSLSISPNTASRHISNIYGKLGISTIAEATVYAISAGVLVLKSNS